MGTSIMARAVASSTVAARARALVNPEATLPSPIEATKRTLVHPAAGRVATYEDTRHSGAPVVLIHGPGIASSAAEMQPLFEALRNERPVVAVDLPGFGGSERALDRIDRALYHDVLADLFTGLVRRFGEAVDVVASGRGAELAAAAILRNEDLVRSLVMVAPTGFSFRNQGPLDRVTANLRAGRWRKLLGNPLVGRSLYAGISSRSALRRSLADVFSGPVDERLLDVSCAMARQTEAWRAPMVFLSGALSDPEVRDRVYARLRLPVLVVFDDESGIGYDALGSFLRAEPTWSAERVRPSRGFPHFDCPEETLAILQRFFAGTEALGMTPLFAPAWGRDGHPAIGAQNVRNGSPR